MYWLGADITWTNIDLSSVAFSEMSLEIIKIAIIKVCYKITQLISPPSPSWANKLMILDKFILACRTFICVTFNFNFKCSFVKIHVFLKTFVWILSHVILVCFIGGGFPSQRPVTRSFYVFFDMCISKRLSKKMRHRWLETPLRSLWCHCNEPTGSKPLETETKQECKSRILHTSFDIFFIFGW